MTRSPEDNLAQSIQARLKNAAIEGGRPFVELLELYAVERFLHRLGRSRQRDRFVLKGAMLLRQWLGAQSRPTRDIDLLGPVDLDATALRAAIAEILSTEVEDDAIVFVEDSIAVRPIRGQSAVLGLRAKFDATLGRARLRYQVDVGLGDAVFPPDVEIIPGGLLAMPMASVRAYTPYSTLAEKLEAVVVLGNANSRTKDYYDLFQLPRALSLEGDLLAESIRRTFARRATPVPPTPLEGLSDAFARDPLHAGRWRAFLDKGHLDVAEEDFVRVVAAIRNFASPVLDAVRAGSSFDRQWPAGGPWR
ncbi:MAG TPA: nucleotidyl transferase AbiEii/AbiGii toxin family protein [Vicinamibacterales bacterium]|nr:nucleotidyl transferase AbiEii/AbiGii toxin family protein [Vicinamibacterales bacterium]HOQ59116.1 nucleotidyl transferase AbiEii/AbiGii toxin family protein [Vicinamibacterales bacterium]HPK71387.1 nucleotidyl transferase AbiEii/AbiGii toxin family protein [Vicinamibacterales bacterium]